MNAVIESCLRLAKVQLEIVIAMALAYITHLPIGYTLMMSFIYNMLRMRPKIELALHQLYFSKQNAVYIHLCILKLTRIVTVKP